MQLSSYTHVIATQTEEWEVPSTPEGFLVPPPSQYPPQRVTTILTTTTIDSFCLFLNLVGMESCSISVCFGCCNKIPKTGWFINNRNLPLTILETGKSKIKVLAN